MRGHVFEPLGMRDSAWTQPEARYPRLAAAYAAGPDGKLSRKSDADIRRLNFSDRKLTRGGAGIATTMNDYLRFARMLLNHGTLDGVRILKPSTVKLMTTDQLDPKITERAWLAEQGQRRVRVRFLRPHRPAQGRRPKIAGRSANSGGTGPGRPCSGSTPPTI